MQVQVTLDKLDEFAEHFWNTIRGTKVFALHGPMGAGKTTIVTALCRQLGVQDALSSPTYSIINEYGFTQHGEMKKIYHIDLYRLKDDEEILQTGVEDAVLSGALCFIEWPQKAPYLFDESTVHLVIEPVDQNTRNIDILSAAEFNLPSIV